MSQQLNLVKVFIASPGGLEKERKLFRGAVEEFNAVRARSDNYLFEPYEGQDTLHGVGRPQGLINEDIRRADIVVMLLWDRWGSSPGGDKYTAATEEEFELAYSLHQSSGRPHILLYFRSVPQAQLADPGPQLQKVNEFKQKIDLDKQLFYGTYERPPLFADLLKKDLVKWLDRQLHGHGYAAAAGNGPAFAEAIGSMKAELQQLQRQVRETNDALKTKEGKLRAAAVGLAVEAARLLARGRLTLAEEKFAQSIALYEEPEVLISYGLFLYQLGSLERAREKFEQVRGLPSTPEHDPHRAVASKKLGNIYLTWGGLDDAERMFEQALAIARGLKRQDLMADFLGALGNVSLERGEIERAEKSFVRALKMSEAAGDRDGMRKAHGALGNVYVERGQLGRAQTTFRKALALAEELGDKEGMENACLGIGIVCERQKKYAEAGEAYTRGLKLAKARGHKAGMERAYGNLGNLYSTRGELTKAKRMYEAALEMARKVGHKDGMALTYANLAAVSEARGEGDEARELRAHALELYQQIGNKAEIKRLSAQPKPKPARPKTTHPARRAAKGGGKKVQKAFAGGKRRPATKGGGKRPYRPFKGGKKR